MTLRIWQQQAVWWLGADVLSHDRGGAVGKWASRLFPDAGVVVMADGETQAIIDAGPSAGVARDTATPTR